MTQLEGGSPDTAYLMFLKKRIEFVLAKNRTVAEDIEKAHHLLSQTANCLHDPGNADSKPHSQKSCSQMVQDMENLIHNTQPDGKIQRAQIRLLNGLQKRWELYGPDLLHCYEIPGLPPDNLKLESFFGRLRRHQRRISGRKSTRELINFGQAQALFIADSLSELLSQIQAIPLELYQRHRQRLTLAEHPRQFFYRFHHAPLATVQALLSQHKARSLILQNQIELLALSELEIHTE